MAAFVGENANQLVGGLGPHDQAGIYEYPLPSGHEGVERTVLDDHDLHPVGVEAGRLPDRNDECPDGVFDLGVAYEVESLRLRGRHRRQREQRETYEDDDAFDHGRHGWQAG